MRKIFAFVLIFVAAISTLAVERDKIYKEVFEFDVTIKTPFGSIAYDEKNSPFLLIDTRTVTFKGFLVSENVKDKRFVSNNHRIVFAADTQKFVKTVIPPENQKPYQMPLVSHLTFKTLVPSENKGVIYLDITLGRTLVETPIGNVYVNWRGYGLPSGTLILGGESFIEFDEDENRYVTKSASGAAFLTMTPEPSAAHDATEKAIYGNTDGKFPAFGTWTMKRVDLTESQIKNIIQNY